MVKSWRLQTSKVYIVKDYGFKKSGITSKANNKEKKYTWITTFVDLLDSELCLIHVLLICVRSKRDESVWCRYCTLSVRWFIHYYHEKSKYEKVISTCKVNCFFFRMVGNHLPIHKYICLVFLLVFNSLIYSVWYLFSSPSNERYTIFRWLTMLNYITW